MLIAEPRQIAQVARVAGRASGQEDERKRGTSTRYVFLVKRETVGACVVGHGSTLQAPESHPFDVPAGLTA